MKRKRRAEEWKIIKKKKIIESIDDTTDQIGLENMIEINKVVDDERSRDFFSDLTGVLDDQKVKYFSVDEEASESSDEDVIRIPRDERIKIEHNEKIEKRLSEYENRYQDMKQNYNKHIHTLRDVHRDYLILTAMREENPNPFDDTYEFLDDISLKEIYRKIDPNDISMHKTMVDILTANKKREEFYKKKIDELTKSTKGIMETIELFKKQNDRLKKILNIPPKLLEVISVGDPEFENQLAFIMGRNNDKFLTVKDIISQMRSEWLYLRDIEYNTLSKQIQEILDKYSKGDLELKLGEVFKKVDGDKYLYNWYPTKLFTRKNVKAIPTENINQLVTSKYYSNLSNNSIIMLILETNKSKYLTFDQIYSEFIRLFGDIIKYNENILYLLLSTRVIIKNIDSNKFITYTYSSDPRKSYIEKFLRNNKSFQFKFLKKISKPPKPKPIIPEEIRLRKQPPREEIRLRKQPQPKKLPTSPPKFSKTTEKLKYFMKRQKSILVEVNMMMSDLTTTTGDDIINLKKKLEKTSYIIKKLESRSIMLSTIQNLQKVIDLELQKKSLQFVTTRPNPTPMNQPPTI